MYKFLLINLLLMMACSGSRSSKSDPPAPIPTLPPIPSPGCDNGRTISFNEDIKPIIARYNCIGCHKYMENYGTWQSERFVFEVIRRTGLGENDNKRMPPPFNESVSAQDRSILQAFQDDGRLENSDCRENVSQGYSFSPLSYIENNVLAYQQRLDNDFDRQNTMFAANCHQRSTWFSAIAKGLNSVSSNQNLILPSTIDPKGCIYAIDLGVYGLSSNDWFRIVDSDPFQFISNTTTGKLIRELANADVPILHGDNMLNIIFDNPDVYYALLDVEVDRDAQLRRLGVNALDQFLAREARVIGLQRTQIAINKNRVFVRYNLEQNVPPGRLGFLWISHDIDLNDLGQGNLVNIFENPLPADSQGNAIYQHSAEEWLWTLPNGLMAGALFEIQRNVVDEIQTRTGGIGITNPRFRPFGAVVGVRVNAAPETTVINLGNKYRSAIQAGNDCLKCHKQGPIIVQDELREAVLAEGDIGFDDLRIVRDSYGTAQVNQVLFNQDRRAYQQAMEYLRVSSQDLDPINEQTDIFRDDWNADRIAPFFYMRKEDFLTRIRNTQVIKQIPQILTGGAISLDTLINVADDIALELEVYEDY